MLSLSLYRLTIATVRPRPSFATGPQFGRLWPIVAPSGVRSSPALITMSMKSGRWNVTLRAAYGFPAFAAIAASMSCCTGTSLPCHVFEPWLIRANVRWTPAFDEHGSQYTSSGATRTYHFELSTVIRDHASSAGTQSLVVKPFAAARR